MDILLENIGRRFNREWIFKAINYRFLQGNSYAVLGPNGSGKSTLLQVLLGSLSSSEGKLSYWSEKGEVDVNDFFLSTSLAAPYQELIEDFTLRELIDFHFSFKRMEDGMNTRLLIELLELERAADKELRYFSSGMRQRTKLALACCAQTPTLFLDEPTTNLDVNGVTWYLNLIERFAKNKLLIIGSNQEHEYSFCQHRIQIEHYKS
ncbi:ATP-binding cassette domain-containing protein [Olivibacter sp. XZL3]|uniref:ABC transporter ATP-binding protein n=1 Tax=Olivibacter sp. XZL3 TaxID=1735116 RepID=UPI001065A248|nr:ATP-binding cassette domain-containing protein [Olivibacter sp. XZL3]